MTVLIPDSLPLSETNLHQLLAGGSGCAPGDDCDLGPDNQTSGWWFYFNSTSDLVELN